MLNRLDQKGTWSSSWAPNSHGAVVEPPAKRRDLTHTVTAAERGKPVVSPQGKATLAREADEAAGMGGGSKRKPICNGSDRSCDITPRRKPADFPLVLAYVNRGQTDLRKQCRNVGEGATLLLVRLPTVPLLALAQ
jgi:hypothetical protein